MEITRSIVIDRPREEVFAYVADARNDPHWCPKVVSTELADSGRYAVVHKPIPGRPAREMTMTCRSQEPPARIEWYEDDGSDTFQVTHVGGRERLDPVHAAEHRVPVHTAPARARHAARHRA